MPVCNKCGKVKKADLFSRLKPHGRADLRSGACKACVSLASAESIARKRYSRWGVKKLRRKIETTDRLLAIQREVLREFYRNG